MEAGEVNRGRPTIEAATKVMRDHQEYREASREAGGDLMSRKTFERAYDDFRVVLNKRLREMTVDLCSELPQQFRPTVRSAVESVIRSIGEPNV